MNLGIKEKVALVTAGSKGIGKAIAMELVSEGCKVAICSRDKDNLINAVSEVKNKFGIEPFWCICDLNKIDDIENTVSNVTKNFGNIDILINNCGGPAAGVFLNLKEEQWYKAFDQVLMSAVRFSKLILRGMIQRNWGRIINITSTSVKAPIENLMLSNSLRSGIVGFAKTLSNEVASNNITVNNVAPGYTLTNRLYDLASITSKQKGISPEDVLKDMAVKIPIKRLAKPEEIASLVSFLASEKASYITGTTIQVDGGKIPNIM